jgi:hypothetical protein
MKGILKNNIVQLLVIFATIAIAWATLNAEVSRIHAQQDINTQGIEFNQAVDQQILITLARIEANQLSMKDTLEEVKSDVKTHINN